MRQDNATTTGTRFLAAYYAATALFVLLDAAWSVNLRLAFLDDWPAARAAWYAACLGCYVLMRYRPGWADAIAAVESMLALAALILSTGARVLLAGPAGATPVTIPEIVNFLLVGGATWLAYTVHVHRWRRDLC